MCIALRGRINEDQCITDLVHVLIGDSVFGTCIDGIVVAWYMQRQEICECGNSNPVQLVRIKGQDLKGLNGY